jgi:erythromycin esterase
MKNLVIVLICVAQCVYAQIHPIENWVKENYYTIDSTYGMNSIIVKPEVQIIGLGEASHGQGSFFKHKINSFKWLVENEGYTIFALEAGFSESLKINQYVLYGEGSAKESLINLNYGVLQIEEFVELIEWMRAYNMNKSPEKHIMFYGFDCQMSKGSVDYLKSGSHIIEHNFSLEELSLLDDLLQLQRTRDKRLAQRIYPLLLNFISSHAKRISDSNQHMTFKKTSLTVLNNLKYFCDTERNSENQNGLNRARFMADNVQHILDIEGKNIKMVLSAHNGHIMTNPKEKETGYWLKQIFGAKYYAIGYEFNQGKILGFDIVDDEIVFRELTIAPSAKGTMGNLLSNFVGKDCLLDLSGSKPNWFLKKQTVSDIMGCYGQKGCMNRYTKTNLALSYDGIVYIEYTEAAKRMENIH